MNTDKYHYEYYTEIPSELRDVKSIVANADELQLEYISRCKRNEKAQLSDSFRHHFIYENNLVGTIQQIIKFNNRWSDNPPKYFIKRYFRPSKSDIIYYETSMLYKCRDCDVYCWSDNRVVVPYNVWQMISDNSENYELCDDEILEY
mgnify:CR=1 FL=1